MQRLSAAEKEPSRILPGQPSPALAAPPVGGAGPPAADFSPAPSPRSSRRGRSSSPAYQVKEKGHGLIQEEREDEERRPIRDMVSEPWNSPVGERLVAVVNDRFLTKKELDSRVALLMQAEQPAADQQSRIELEEERINLAQGIMDDWVMNTTLALEAVKNGYSVTGKEIDEALQKIAQSTTTDVEQVAQRVRTVGVPQDQLRAELRDGLLIEKLILPVVRSYDKGYYQKVFETEPTAFLIPPRARAFHIYRALDASMTAKQQKQIRAELEELRKELKKAKPNYDALTNKSDKDAQLAIGDTGWVSADAGLPSELHKVIFGLEKGQTSEIFVSGMGAHVVRVIEREEGSKFTLEAAMPQIENYLFQKTKVAAYEALRPSYKISTNSGGLNRWKEAPGSGPRRIARPGGAASPAPVSALAPIAPIGPVSPAASPAQPSQPDAAKPAPAVDLRALGGGTAR